jgi:hypothetical protein
MVEHNYIQCFVRLFRDMISKDSFHILVSHSILFGDKSLSPHVVFAITSYNSVPV